MNEVLLPILPHKWTSSVRRFRWHDPAAPQAAGRYKVGEVVRLYRFPKAHTGKGQCIGLIEPAGGYDPADLAAFCAGEGLRVPEVVHVGENKPGVEPVADL